MSSGLYPLSHKFTPIKEATRNKRESLYGQITLQRQDHENKSLKRVKGYNFHPYKAMIIKALKYIKRLQLPFTQDHESKP